MSQEAPPASGAEVFEERCQRLESLLTGMLEKAGTSGNGSHPAAITVAAVIERFLIMKRIKCASGVYCAKTLDRFERRLSSFVEQCGDRPVSACSNQDIATWIAGHSEWKSSHTKTDAAGAVVTCFYWAAEERIIPYSPFTRPRGLWPALLPRIAITPAEYRLAMLAAKRRGYQRARLAFREALFFLWQTGARTCEMRELCWEHIDFSAGIASLTVHKTVRTSGEARLIALSKVLLRLLHWMHRQKGRPKSGHVFTNSQGKPWESQRFANYFQKVAKFAGIRTGLSPYCLRHGFCVQGLENGVGDRQLADLLGHSTSRYVAWYGKSTRRHGDYLRGVLDQIHRPKDRPKGGP